MEVIIMHFLLQRHRTSHILPPIRIMCMSFTSINNKDNCNTTAATAAVCDYGMKVDNNNINESNVSTPIAWWRRGAALLKETLDVNMPSEKVLYKFSRDTDIDGGFIQLCDSEIGGGSSMELDVSGGDDHSSLHFKGHISNQRPHTGIKRSGFCAFRSKNCKGKLTMNSLNTLRRSHPLDMTGFDMIEMRVRGDGRTYVCNLKPDSIVHPEDLYQKHFTTKGGPYWEIVELPLESFLLTYRGSVQNHQITMQHQNIQTIGILIADSVDGPFSLEIDYIKIKAVMGTVGRRYVKFSGADHDNSRQGRTSLKWLSNV